jgi:betaine-aldehyde dehydrogenase
MERGRILKAAAALLRERNSELALLETRDTGKPIQETSTVDVLSGADCLEYFGGIAAGLSGEHIDLGPSAFGYTRREPLGVVAGSVREPPAPDRVPASPASPAMP